MPRDLPIGNGALLVCFDQTYQIRDLYWPHVGQENHSSGHTFRVGVWVEGEMRWLDDPRWERELRYHPESLVTDVRLSHPDLGITLEIADAVDFHEHLLVRRCTVTSGDAREREVCIFFHHDFHISGNEVGDTAYYEPERRAVIHYKGARWFLANGAVETSGDDSPGWLPTSDTAPGLVVGVHQWACGYKEMGGQEGTWRDAEDGQLSGNPVAQGSVDSTVGFHLRVAADRPRNLYYWLAVGPDFNSVAIVNRLVRERGPERLLGRTEAYWRLWLRTHLTDMKGLSPEVCDEYERSLLIIGTQIDGAGGIVAANDTDISSQVRDTYSYVWPRDGALVASALTLADHVDLPRGFFNFCARGISAEGYLLHKYNPDGTLASSWLPWYRDGEKDLPIQEDETALVLWALWKHFERFGDVEFIKPLYRPFIMAAADFLARFRDPESGLPLSSYDLWEERYGVHAFTVGAVWAGLSAAGSFAEAFGEVGEAAAYREAAEGIRRGAEAHLWLSEEEHFARMITRQSDGSWLADRTLDSATAGLWLFGMCAPNAPRIVATMSAIRERLWVKTAIGGIARYERDSYNHVVSDNAGIAGNPWFVCTLWFAEWLAETAGTPEDLGRSAELLSWACAHALPSGVLAEQVHPYTGAPLSVSPLTWSHASFVSAVHAYLRAQGRLSAVG